MDRYAFLMIKYYQPAIISKLLDSIDKDDLYEDDTDDYGIEYDSHITLVPCLSNNIEVKALKPYLRPIRYYKTKLLKLSIFSNPDKGYDVLKFDADSDELIKTNKLITNNFETFSEFKDYKPHLTIAYLRKGCSDKYLNKYRDLKDINIDPMGFQLSYYVNNRMEYVFW